MRKRRRLLPIPIPDRPVITFFAVRSDVPRSVEVLPTVEAIFDRLVIAANPTAFQVFRIGFGR